MTDPSPAIRALIEQWRSEADAQRLEQAPEFAAEVEARIKAEAAFIAAAPRLVRELLALLAHADPVSDPSETGREGFWEWLAANQKDLPEEAKAILYKNLWKLYDQSSGEV